MKLSDRSPRIAAGIAATLAVGVLTALAIGGAGDDAPIAVDPRPGTSTSIEVEPTLDVATTATTGSATVVPSSPPISTAPVGPEVPEFDPDDPAVAARPLPDEPDPDDPPPSTVAPPPWAASTMRTSAGQLSTDVGCAVDLTAEGLHAFLGERLGPLIGWDYQHVYPLGGDRHLWLFQDAFLDHSGTVTSLGRARFVHNAALLQTGRCFELLHRGTTTAPQPFEVGDGTGDIRTKWWWPLGGETFDGELRVFWAEMVKDPYDPQPPDGLGWHPARTFLATYDAASLERRSFGLAPDSGVVPIYGYAVASDDRHSYLFGNTFEQNLVREGGFWNGPHSATRMWLARVPRGRLGDRPEYRTADGWSPDPAAAVPIVERFYVENPMQPRLLDGQWVSATAVDGYWGDSLAIDVAPQPWGPWTTVELRPLAPRGNDPLMNTYHAQPLPWRDGFGSVLITVSNNARDMLRHAWPHPYRYRPMVVFSPFVPTPPETTTTSTTTSTTSTTTSTTSTTAVPRTTTSTTTTTSTSTTTLPATTTSSSSPTTTSTSTSSTSTTSTSTTSTTLGP